MENFTFIKSTNTEEYPNPVYAISVDISEMRVSETYDRFGQPVTPADAGDYITLDTQKAVDIANNAYKEFEDEEIDEMFSLNETISDYEQGNVFTAINSAEELKEGLDFTYYASTCKGFNYFDGSNWQSIVIHYEDDGQPNYEVIENDSLESEIDSKEWIKDGFGKKLYESENFWIIHNYCVGSFASYELYSKKEYDLEDIF